MGNQFDILFSKVPTIKLPFMFTLRQSFIFLKKQIYFFDTIYSGDPTTGHLKYELYKHFNGHFYPTATLNITE